MRAVTAQISGRALQHNFARVKQLAPTCKIMSVVKANAYGHGLLTVVNLLHESDYFAVARLQEARYLREQGIKHTIFLLEGVYSRDDYNECAKEQFIPAIHCLAQFHCLQDYYAQAHCLPHSLEYWLKCDTGMHRLGLSVEELTFIIEYFKTLSSKNNNKHLCNGLMSHFCCADEIDNPKNSQQLIQFDQFYQLLLSYEAKNKSIQQSMANSAAILSSPESHFDWLRPGIMLYGISPFESKETLATGLDEQLLPVMTLSAPIIAIKRLKKGDSIGYGGRFCCPENMTIAIVAIGYGDGYPRHAKSGTPVLVHNIEVPLVGRVSMDMITIDLSVLEAQSMLPNIGDRAILWGEGLPIEKVAQHADTIAYELLCQITQRVHFHYDTK